MGALRAWKAYIQVAREQFSRKEYDLAEGSLKAALEAAKVFGRDSGAYATSMLNLAQLYRRRSKLPEAVPLLESAIFVLESTAGPNNQVTVTAIYDLALTLSEQGKAAEAKVHYDDALRRLEEAAVRQKYGDAPAALLSVRAKGIACGKDFSLVLSEAGEVHSFGDNRAGQLGRASATPSAPSDAAPALVQGLEGLRVRTVSGGATHALAVTEEGGAVANPEEDGALYSWGGGGAAAW